MKDTLIPLYCSYSLLSAYSLAKIPNADDSSHTRLILQLKEIVGVWEQVKETRLTKF